MKKILLSFVTILVLNSSYSEAKDWAKLNIFACTPEWGSLAQEIVGNKANVFVALSPLQDPHNVKINSNFDALTPSSNSSNSKINSATKNEIAKADIVFCTGANLEASWLPALLADLYNKKQINEGGEGYFMAADYINKLEVPKEPLEKNQINNHPLGNPHIHLNPHNIIFIAQKFTEVVSKLDSVNKSFYQSQYDNFNLRWNQAMVKWENDAASLKGMSVIVNHNEWAYLADWLGLNIIASIEESPGMAPSKKYIGGVLRSLNANPAEMILYAPYESNKRVLWMRKESRTKDVLLPYTVFAHPKIRNLFDLFDFTINTMQIERKRRKTVINGYLLGNSGIQIHSYTHQAQ